MHILKAGRRYYFFLMMLLSSAVNAAGTLGIDITDRSGDPIDVGLLFIGHSTSKVGGYPDKLVSTLNFVRSDGRNYVAFDGQSAGDGGFYWSQMLARQNSIQYQRMQAREGQYCEDGRSRRWSCRRLKIDRSITGADRAGSACCSASVPTPVASCVWHENGVRHEALNVEFKTCWERMDIHIALVQDSTSRSFPVNDYTGEGIVDVADFIPADIVDSVVLPCSGLAPSGVVNGLLDWNCDGRITANDSAPRRYSKWLKILGKTLINRYGLDYVVYSMKPVETAGCRFFNGTCIRGQTSHGIHVPTASEPFNRFYKPSVYWEYRGFEEFATTNRDERMMLLHPGNVRRMWQRSAECYTRGLSTWSIPANVPYDFPRPTVIEADDSEVDNGAGANADIKGCNLADHRHHNDNGGWMMADVWYQGLKWRLQDTE
ncbi:hypothetical protein MNBD_GAMMA10-770 [hydrothermal vent metagenome]|uniref:Uncharacterized protein n=1 Tax=hydrothermal vent metagenome TaxID=652676 RepID=A0A3B0YKE4_9ZZZZ